MQPIAPLMILLSVLFPACTWTPIGQPVTVQVRSAGAVTVVLTDMAGKIINPVDGPDSANAEPNSAVDLRKLYLPQINQPGTYLVWAIPKGGKLADFQGTPLVLEIRPNVGPEAVPGPAVVHLEPLVYAVVDTDMGTMDAIFYFDAAPNTVENFLKLSEENFYDGLNFHRIVPDFIIQGGDPRGDGTGGPGYTINSEFNDRPHEAGALSMAREVDPVEQDGGAPHAQFTNSAGSQFFISISRQKTGSLDRHYTVFGKVVRGGDVINKIGAAPLGDDNKTASKTPIVIKSIKIKPVTPLADPYADILHLPPTTEPTTQPTTAPSATAISDDTTQPTTMAAPTTP